MCVCARVCLKHLRNGSTSDKNKKYLHSVAIWLGAMNPKNEEDMFSFVNITVLMLVSKLAIQ